MRRDRSITARIVLAADVRVRSISLRRAMRELERREPELAEYVMEKSTSLYVRLERACPSHRSARSLHRIQRVARTIADLADCAQITTAHLTEAIGYRRLDRGAPVTA